MAKIFYKLPTDLAQDIENHAADVSRFLAGELSPLIFKARRVPRGIYEQRQNGTYMVRVRIAGGRFSDEQARMLAELSRAFSNGMLHITDRQDIQLHAINIQHTPDILSRLATVGLTTKGGGGNTVRNVTACPYAGICRAEFFDVAPLAWAVTEYLIAQPGSYNLPRKYKIAFSGCAADCALAEVHDLGFLAEMRAGHPGFRVYAGGGLGAHSRVADMLQDWIPTTEVIRVAESVRRLFDRFGDRHNKHRARLRFVLEQMGLDAFRRAFQDEMPQVLADGVPDCRVSVATMSNPEAGKAASQGITFIQQHGVRVFPQRQRGYFGVPIHIPLGFVSWQDFSRLADISAQFSAEKGLRATQAQGLLLGFVKKEALPDLATALGRLSVDVLSQTPLTSFVSCAGASTCRLGLCLSRNAAMACAEAIKKDGIKPEVLDKLDIRISGCPNSCGHHPVGTIGFFGIAQRHQERLVPSYGVLLAARRGKGRTRLGRQVGTVPARALPALILDLLRDFQTNRGKAELFADYYDRRGAPHFKEILERHTRIPDYAADPVYYRDWDQNQDFSLAGRGPGECGAGVFEVVAEDIAAAKQALHAAAPIEGQEQALFKALLATVRALLIVRGLDSSNPDEIFHAFETHFIDRRLVSDDFRVLLARARGYLHGWHDALVDRKEEIRRLLERVELLFSVLDANLNFHPPESEAPPAPAGGVFAESAGLSAEAIRAKGEAPIAQCLAAKADAPATDAAPSTSPAKNARPPAANLDLCGVTCPMNFVKAKLRLETLEIGDTLSIILDEGEPVQNVPASFRQEGQDVVEMTKLNDKHWRVVIKKKR